MRRRRLPILSWERVVAVLEKAGYVFLRQRGSHMVYGHPETKSIIVVPRHKEIKRGILRGIIREAGLTREEFLGLSG